MSDAQDNRSSTSGSLIRKVTSVKIALNSRRFPRRSPARVARVISLLTVLSLLTLAPVLLPPRWPRHRATSRPHWSWVMA